ncbi:MAG: hypothetical protein KAJ12_13780, partial [Bacteroidetes bacterium]|nr:hypothetical protein [Bacteroidota bacterium]
MILRILRIVVLGVAYVSSGIGQESSTEITAEDIREHIKYLASDELEGRWAGTAGNEKAAAYIAERLEELGVSPAGDDGSFLQRFEFVSTVRQGDANALAFEFRGVK